MIIRNLFRPRNEAGTMTLPELVDNLYPTTASGRSVTPENAKNVATAYRCINMLCNDFAKLPEQVFISRGPGQIERMKPSSRMQNAAYLLTVSPNRWHTPLKFKRLRMRWLLCWGASYVWLPPMRPGRRRELFILPSNRTRPLFDLDGNLWYETVFANGQKEYLPDVEVMALVINSEDGISGKSVIQHAREAIGRRMGASDSKGNYYQRGLNAGGILWLNGTANKEAKNKLRGEFGEQMVGSENAYGLAVMDNTVSKFEKIEMRPVDVAYLQSIDQDDIEIANFFEMPLYKLNMGKEAYNSNEQQNLDYLNTTLDPYLIQAEEVDAQRILTEMEQEIAYIRFNRDALLRTDAKTRTETIQKRVQMGALTPNEGRQIEDLPAYEGGDGHYFPANMAQIMPDGSLKGGTASAGANDPNSAGNQ